MKEAMTKIELVEFGKTFGKVHHRLISTTTKLRGP
jgi:hypothetical protein